MTLYTVGHSTRSAEEFLELLRRYGIERVVDVRAFPGSRRYPHFGRDALRATLAAAGIDYLHAPALGGRRKPRPEAPPTAWRNAGFAAYADYMTTPEFRTAIDELLRVGAQRRTVIMCSEAVPWRCHRTMISDAVVARGWPVTHLMDNGVSAHQMTRWAAVDSDEVRYPVEPEEQPSLPLSGA